MKQLENVGLTHTHTHTQFAERIGKLIFMAVLLPVFGLQAQFINPTTPDIVISCRSNDVENTGTSILGDWQVTVMDGDKPSIIFYNHATGQEDCHLLEAVNLGYTVSDPDVVWDYDSQEYIYVVYQLRGGGTGFDGIWSERWRMDISGAFIFAMLVILT